MSWVKLADRAWTDPKLRSVSARAFRLWAFGLCWCNQQRTDGDIPRSTLRLLDGTMAQVKELVAAGLWTETRTGWSVVSYLKWQRSKTQIELDQNSTRTRVKRHRDTSKSTDEVCVSGNEQKQEVKPDVTPLHFPCNAVSNGDVTLAEEKRREEKRTERREKTTPKDLTGSARVEAPASPGSSSKVPCPVGLSLSPAQRATLESSMIPPWAIEELTRRFVLKAVADTSDQRPVGIWLKCLGQAISSDWNNPNKRPREPRKVEAQVTAGESRMLLGESPAEATRRRQRERAAHLEQLEHQESIGTFLLTGAS